jgi:prepilin-type N-terminal cleavage/methylation domain-containing protein
MKRASGTIRQEGFSLIELLVALGIFLVVTGAAFTLLGSSQQRYRTESQVLNSFQEARLGLDQIVRDVNDAGYPPASFNGGDSTQFATSPFAWIPNYPNNPPCQIGAGCATPGDFDLIIETNDNPLDPACIPTCPVSWIRYQLQGTTLVRGRVNKPVGGGDPANAFNGPNAPVPFVQNVVNTPAQPIFSYTCDTLTPPGTPPLPCPVAAAADNIPANIRDVIITLIVAAPQPDAISGQQRIVTLTGRGRRVNP